jgi:hypothetical protein
MARVRDLLEDESTTVELEGDHFERLLRRRERKQRNRRLSAAIVVIAIVIVGIRSLMLGMATEVPIVNLPDPQPSTSTPTIKVMRSDTFEPTFTFALPDSWTGARGTDGEPGDDPRYLGLSPIGTPDGERTGIFVLRNALAVKQNCSGNPDPGVGTSSAAITDWMTTYDRLDATTPQPVRIGRVPGHWVEIGLPFGRQPCPGFQDIPILVGEPHRPNWGIEPGTQMRVYVLDLAGGKTVTIMIEVQDPAQFQALKHEAIPIVESFDFSP